MPDIHRMPVRIYFEDTDSGGIVYYANYLKFAERGRTEYLRQLGIESSWVMDSLGIGLAVRRCNIEYLRPAKLDDQVVVETELQKIGGASMQLRQVITRDAEALVEMDIKLASIHFSTGRPSAFPADLKAALVKQMNASSQLKK
ncbi:MAG: tol-pal system-associated acyl-CoA thioesterase [Rhodospirillales bacterium]|nr:tol-pal system-associated acyl-CoA thioesterase [Rhodospirillales bacterium]